MKTVKYRDYQAALTAEDPIRLGVNWAACGTVLPKDAAKFGDRLLDAAMAAEEFLYNGYVIDYSK